MNVLGRIKTILIKRTTFQLFDAHKDEFKTEFEANKMIVDKFADIPSKKTRNVITGYITRLTRQNANNGGN